MRVPFCSQDCSRNRQDSLKILAGAAKILSNSPDICEGQKCSGVRRSSRKRTTITSLSLYIYIYIYISILLFAYARTAALHYTPGARRCAENCSESWQLLSESCQNLGDFCQNLARKMQSRWPNTMPRNCKKIIQKSVPKHQNPSKLPKMLPDQKK